MHKSILFGLFSFLLASPAFAACPATVKTPLSFVSLWNDEAAANLENLNQLETLCPEGDKTADCLQKALQPNLRTIPIFSAPEAKQPLGAFITLFTPGKGASLSYLDLQTPQGFTIDTEPDMFDPDWGYGPYFHQTLISQQGDWYEVAVPSAPHKTGWVQLKNNPDILTLEKGGRLVTLASRSYAIADIKDDYILLRDEQPADFACGAENPPPLEDFTPIKVPLAELYTNSCQLRLKVGYTRGC